jgi:5-methylcytosine-specific restriction enzyme subunit McrC
MPASPIPVENIYFMFCYAWDRFREGVEFDTGAEDSPDLPNLLAQVLVNATQGLLRRGLDRSYETECDDLPTVRGRIELEGTIGLMARRSKRVYCEFDELTPDVLHNQIIKTTLQRLTRVESISPSLAHEMRLTARRFGGVSEIRLSGSAFRRVSLHRNNASYDLALRICELAFHNLIPRENGAGYRFKDVLGDGVQMGKVFEAFVRNFYRKNEKKFRVIPLALKWDATAIGDSDPSLLPQMVTDVFLDCPDRQIIIDTKYYPNAMQENWGKESYISANLYQLFTYLKNAESDKRIRPSAEGMLLYPQNGQRITDKYEIQGHSVRLATVNLGQPWKQIEAELLSLLVN